MQAQRTKAPRRVKTKSPGVYKSVSGRYEIAYRDSDGKLRFQTIGDNLEEAKAARAEIVAKMGRGETVRSTSDLRGAGGDVVRHEGSSAPASHAAVLPGRA